MNSEIYLNWYHRPAEMVARDLVGKQLCRRFDDGQVVKLEINEVEAYVGPLDSASHSFGNRRTTRTETMYQKPGTIYMYFIYGKYWMLNIVTDEIEYPSAVLIRGAGEYDGPGKLTRALLLDKTFNSQLLGQKTGLWVEKRSDSTDITITATPRIGINYAVEPWRSAPLRFILKDK